MIWLICGMWGEKGTNEFTYKTESLVENKLVTGEKGERTDKLGD